MSRKILKRKFEENGQEEAESDGEQSEQQDEDGDDKEDDADDEEEEKEHPEEGEDEEIQYPELTVESYGLKMTEAMVSWLIPDLADIVKGYLNSARSYFASAPVTGGLYGGRVTLFAEQQFRELDQKKRENGCQRTTGLDLDQKKVVCGDPIQRLFVDFEDHEICLCETHARALLDWYDKL